MIKPDLNTKLVMPNSAASEAASTPLRRSSCQLEITVTHHESLDLVRLQLHLTNE